MSVVIAVVIVALVQLLSQHHKINAVLYFQSGRVFDVSQFSSPPLNSLPMAVLRCCYQIATMLSLSFVFLFTLSVLYPLWGRVSKANIAATKQELQSLNSSKHIRRIKSLLMKPGNVTDNKPWFSKTSGFFDQALPFVKPHKAHNIYSYLIYMKTSLYRGRSCLTICPWVALVQL